MADKNRTPEQKARDTIDQLLDEAGWKVQSKNEIDFSAGFGIAIREYQTDVGPADYVLFIDKNPVGVIEAKPEDWGQKITTVEDQSAGLRGRKAEMAQQQGAASLHLREHGRRDALPGLQRLLDDIDDTTAGRPETNQVLDARMNK